MRLKLPARFTLDHLERADGSDWPGRREVLKLHGPPGEPRAVTLDVNAEAFREMEADAEFYSDRRHFDDPELLGLVTSARAVLKALRVARSGGKLP